MIEPILMLITIIWVLIGAIKIMPHFADKKVSRKGGKIDKLEQGFHKRLDRIEKNIPKVPKDIPTMVGIQAELDKIQNSIPKNIPTMKEIQAERKKTTDNLMDFQKAIPNLIIQTVKTKEFAAEVESYTKSTEGRMYRAKGIDMANYEKGVDAAQTIFLDKVQNQDPNHQERNEMMLIIRDTIKTAEQAGLIEEGSVDQKMGVVQGVMGIIDKLQARNNGRSSSSPQSGGFLLAPPQLTSGSNELEGYYR